MGLIKMERKDTYRALLGNAREEQTNGNESYTQ